MLLSSRKNSDYIFRQELAILQERNPRLKVMATMSDPQGEPWTGLTGRIDKALLEHAMKGFDVQRVHLCGPPAMMDTVKAALIEFGVPKEHVRTEAFGTAKRIPTIRAAKGAKLAGRVIFQRSQVTAAAPMGFTLLDVADANDVYIDSACRSGTCGLCRVKLLSGNAHMEVTDALTEDDKADGYILACQAEPGSDLEIDA